MKPDNITFAHRGIFQQLDHELTKNAVQSSHSQET